MAVLSPAPKHTPITRDPVSDAWGRWFDQLYQNSAVSALGSALTDSYIFVGNSSGVATAVSMSGDASISNSGVLTLATVASAGTTGGSTAIPVITIDAKGRVTSVTTAAVIAPAGTLTGTTLAANVVNSSLTSVGTLISGTWNATAIGIGYGGTGLSGVGTANQLFGTNAGATGYEHKAVTATLAGALAGITTLNMSGDLTISAGNVNVADTYGVHAGSGYRLADRNGTYLRIGTSGGNWTHAEYYVNTNHTFGISGSGGRLSITSTTTSTGNNLEVTGTSLLTAAVTASSTLTVADNMAIGGAILDYNALTITGAIMSGATSNNGLVVDVTGISAATNFLRGAYFKVSTAAAAYAVNEMNVIEAAEPTVGAGSSITTLRSVMINAAGGAVATHKHGLVVEAIVGGVTTNRAIQTGNTGDVLFGYLAGTGSRYVNVDANGILGATSSTFPSTATQGDLLYASAANVWSNLALGTTLQVLSVNAGATQVEWAAVTGTGSVMRAVSPTTTGTLTAGAANFGSDVSLSTVLSGGGGVWKNVSNAFVSHSSAAFIQISRNSEVAYSASAFGTDGAGVYFRQASGTYASQTATAAGRTIGFLGAYGHDATSITAGAKALISLKAINLWSGTDNSTQIVFATTPTGSITRADIAVITSTGFRIGNGTAPTVALDVTGAALISSTLGVTGISTLTGNVALFGAGSFGTGTGVMSIINASVAPSTNPTGGGVLYTSAGALKYRGSSGTVTTLAVA